MRKAFVLNSYHQFWFKGLSSCLTGIISWQLHIDCPSFPYTQPIIEKWDMQMDYII